MILTRLTVKRLKALRDRTIDFLPGLNVIKGGDNEAGKSSLRIAITKALFQDPTTKQPDIHGLTSWGTDEPWEVELEFQTDSESYRITKSLKQGSCQLLEASSSRIIATSKHAIADKIAEVTGCPSEVIFESTACIGQDELIGIIPEAAKRKRRLQALGTITQRLEGMLSGAEGADVVPTIVSGLYSKTHEKQAKGPYWHLEAIRKQIESLGEEKRAQQRKVDKIVENRRRLNRVEEELGRLSTDLPANEELLRKNEKILLLDTGIARDKTQYETFTRAKEFRSALDTLDKELEQFACFIEGKANIDQLNSAKNELQVLEGQRASLLEHIETVRGQRPALWMLFAGLALLTVGIAGMITIRYLGIVALAGLLLSGYWFVSQAVLSRQMRSMSSKVAELDTTIQTNDQEIEQVLKFLGFQDYGQYQRQLATYEQKMKERKEKSDKLAGILGDRDWGQFERDNSDLDIRVSANQKELQQLLPFKMDPLKLQKLAREVREQQQQRDRLDKEKISLEGSFAMADVDTDQLANVEEELRWLEEQKEFWERKKRVYDITREALDEAHKETFSKAADVLQKELGRYISTITGGRYSRVKMEKMGESDVSIRTFSPEKADWVDVRNLSRATQDQFYISARFALVKLITEDKRPPLLLDDPFVNFHPTRLRRTIPLLEELAREYQILLFTCSDAYDDLGNVISLD